MNKIYWLIIVQLGLNFKKTFYALFYFPKFLRDYITFRKSYKGKMNFKPCLHDIYEEAGTINSEYFIQDLLVAKKIFNSNPSRHLDVGSRIDGFVSNVASFRQIDVLDIRPLTSSFLDINFKQADLMSKDDILKKYNIKPSESVSCLHTLEHFGLGRYGDQVDSGGHLTGMMNLSKLVCKKGTLYLSVPIGLDRVEFNANRVFSPRFIVRGFINLGLKIENITIINSNGTISNVLYDSKEFKNIENESYNLGIFEFTKP